MTRRQKDPLRALTAEEREALAKIGRMRSERADIVARTKALLAVARGGDGAGLERRADDALRLGRQRARSGASEAGRNGMGWTTRGAIAAIPSAVSVVPLPGALIATYMANDPLASASARPQFGSTS